MLGDLVKIGELTGGESVMTECWFLFVGPHHTYGVHGHELREGMQVGEGMPGKGDYGGWGQNETTVIA